MSLLTSGINTSVSTDKHTGVTNITPTGFWVILSGCEYFISFNDYPVFKDARISNILNMEFYQNTHLRWKELDIDIELESLSSPEKYPLRFR